MKKLFLSSSFCDVAKYLTDFCGEELKGKTVTFIPTASLVEEYAGYVENDKNAFIELGIFVDVLNIEQVDDKTKAAELKNYSGLGLIDFYPLPHYGNEPFAEHIENIYKEYHNKIPLIPISNSQVIEFKNNEKTIKG